MLCAIAAGTALVSGAAVAGTPPPFKGEARLVSAASAPRAETIAGVTWQCDGDTCRGEAPRKTNLDGVVRECKKVAAVLGPIASYRTGARDLTDGELKACNRGAVSMTTAAN
jgi:hypothetical protein